MKPGSRSVRALAAAAAIALLAAPFAPRAAQAHTAKAPVTLNFWTWVTGVDKAAAIYNTAHPNVKIVVREFGAGGTTFYPKLTTALKAGVGAPDLTQVEYQYIPQYLASGGLADISASGANSAKNLFAPGTWAVVSQGHGVYAIPQDTGPMGMYFNTAVFDTYHVAVPTTWSEYAAAAAKLHAANPKVYITDWDPTNPSQLFALIWQAGGNLFSGAGNDWKVTLDTPIARKVVAYWGNLVSKGLVKIEGHWGPVHADWANGTVATELTAVWETANFPQNAPRLAGDWRVSQLPQYTKGAHVGAVWGGSTTAVTKYSKDPVDAVKFAIWLNTDPAAYNILQAGALWPAAIPLLNAKAKATPPGVSKFYGGLNVNAIFAAINATVPTTFQWGPAMSYASDQVTANIQAADTGKISWSDVLTKSQQSVVHFMTAQGFNVS